MKSGVALSTAQSRDLRRLMARLRLTSTRLQSRAPPQTLHLEAENTPLLSLSRLTVPHKATTSIRTRERALSTPIRATTATLRRIVT